MDPSITFIGSIDDTVAGRHTLLLGAVAEEAVAINNPPTVDLSFASIGQNSRPFSYNIQTLILNNSGAPTGSGSVSIPISSTTVTGSTIRTLAGITTSVGQGTPPVILAPFRMPIPPVATEAFLPIETPVPLVVAAPIVTINTTVAKSLPAPSREVVTEFGSGTLLASINSSTNFSVNENSAVGSSSVQVVMSAVEAMQSTDCKSSNAEEGDCL
jgi:hypothetical protein